MSCFKVNTVEMILSKLEDCYDNEEECEYYRRLWTRVKVGINIYIDFCKPDAQKINKATTLWNLLSFSIQCHVSNENMLFTTIKEMLELFHSFLQDCGYDDISIQNCNYKSHCLDHFDEINCVMLQQSLSKGILMNTFTSELFYKHLHQRYLYLDETGTLSNLATRCANLGQIDGLLIVDFDLKSMFSEIKTWLVSLKRFNEPKFYHRPCRVVFEDKIQQASTAITQSCCSHFEAVYHSLDCENLRSLISALELVKDLSSEYYETYNDSHTTIRELLEKSYPGAIESEYLSCAYIDL